MEPTVDLWTRHGPDLRRFVARRVRDSHVADDIVQDVMVKVEANRESLPPAEKLGAWLLRIARNAVIDFYRQRHHRERQLSDAFDLGQAGSSMEASGCTGHRRSS